MEKKVKKTMLIFVLIMIIFTVVSRATDSMTVAQVTVSNSKRGELIYRISGTGTIKEKTQRYIALINNYKVGKVSSKLGQKIQKGDLLFTYDMEMLREKKEAFEDELKKLELDYKKELLSTANGNNRTDMETAVINKKNAIEDLEYSEEEMNKTIESVKKKKKKEYETAKSELLVAERSMNEELRKLKREINTADMQADEESKTRTKVTNAIEAYKFAVIFNNETNITTEYTKLYNLYLDGSYKDYKQELEDAKQKVIRTKEDYKDIDDKWTQVINPYGKYYPKEDEIRQEYDKQSLERDTELRTANRSIQDAEEEETKLIEKYKSLEDAIDHYRLALKGDSYHPDATYQTLLKLFTDKFNIDESKIKNAEEALSYSKEDYKETEDEWEKKIADLQDKTDKLKSELSQMNSGTYDYDEDLADINKSIISSKRAIKQAEQQIQKENEGNAVTASNRITEQQAKKLTLESMQVDINNKQDELNEINRLIVIKGGVLSPVSGIILSTELREGMVIGGQEKLVISTEDYEMEASADKDQMKYFSQGDEIKLKTIGNKKEIKARIDEMELPDNDGKVLFTVYLQGEYQVGGSLEYEATKNSSNYSACIPIQGLRQDNSGTYILLIKETKGVLGAEQMAFRLDVVLLDKDSTKAAIDASISNDDKIIIGSNKNIAEGDRVRVNEKE